MELFVRKAAMKTLAQIALASFLCVHGAAQAALLDRGGGLLYDDVLNITWLQDANYAKTSGYDADGRMSEAGAKSWAENLQFYDVVRNVNYDDWRLASNSPEGHPFHYGWWFAVGDENATQGPPSELSHMYYSNLGLHGYRSSNGGQWGSDFGIFGNGTLSGQNNVGLVMNLQAGEYLSDAAPAPYPYNRPWTFSTNTGNHQLRLSGELHFSWAVRDGDVAVTAIPEPETYALMLSGLGLIGFELRRRQTRLESKGLF